MASPAKKEMNVFAYHRETVKPSSPTPSHLQTFKLSLLDQLHPPMHMPGLFFYAASPKGGPTTVGQLLKKSLSETLTRFYPFAGRLNIDAPVINCNDDGAVYIEARANIPMANVLQRPEFEEIQHFIPTSPADLRLDLVPLVLAQATFFECGGMVLGTAISHKVADGCSIYTFMETWSRIASGLPGAVLVPDFTGPTRFPSQHTLSINLMSHELGDCTQRRFVFDANKVRKLKAIAASDAVPHPSTTEAVSALLWKCSKKAAAAARTNRSEKKFSSSFIVWAVNIRPLLNPPLPYYSTGNLIGPLSLKQDEMKNGGDQSLQAIVCRSREKRNEFIQTFSRKDQVNTFMSLLDDYTKQWGEGIMSGDCYCHIVSSLCGMDFYGTNFGWGKVIWVSVPFSDVRNQSFLLDLPDGGVEAWVSMAKQEIILLEHDPEFCEFAAVNPSPLHNNAKDNSYTTLRPSAL